MQWILCSMIECSGFHAAWLNAVDFMQHGPKHPDWMQWSPWSIIECRVFHELWHNGSRLYAVESMQCDECMDSRQPGKMHPDWTQCIQCIVAKWIPIQCSGFYEAWPNWSQLNAVDSMHHGAMDPNWMQWNRCSVIECSVFHAAWRNGTQLNARILCSITECSGFKKQDWMQWILCSMAQSIPMECSGFHALWLNAVNCMQRGKMHPDWMQWIPSSVIKCSRFHTA